MSIHIKKIIIFFIIIISIISISYFIYTRGNYMNNKDVFKLFKSPINYELNIDKKLIPFQYTISNNIRKNTGLGKDFDCYMQILSQPVETEINYKNHTTNIIKQNDNIICLEHIPDKKIKNGYIFIPNQELVSISDEKKLLEPDTVKVVICKSVYAYNIFKKFKTKYNCSWDIKIFCFPPISYNLFFSYPKHKNIYFHPAGGSWMKNTSVLIKAWINNPHWPLLIITCKGECLKKIDKKYLSIINNTSNIIFYSKLLNKSEISYLQKYSGFLIMPSSCEGYGHSVYEALENGNLLITSDIPPLNENLKDGYNCMLIPTISSAKLGYPEKDYGWFKNYSKKIGSMGSACFNISVKDIENIIEKSLLLNSNKYNNIRLNGLYTYSKLVSDGIKSLRKVFKEVGLNIKHPDKYIIPKVFDCFMGSSGEEELLLLRIMISNSYVDKYIIIDSDESHSGKPKKLLDLSIIPTNLQHKIIYENVKFPNTLKLTKKSQDSKIAWEREGYQRDRIMHYLNMLADPDDFCFISDLDEIPFYDRILPNSHNDIIIHYELPTYVFNINFMQKDYKPHCAIGSKYKNLIKANLPLTEIRFEGKRNKDGGVDKTVKAKYIEKNCTMHLNRFFSAQNLVNKEKYIVEKNGSYNSDDISKIYRRYFKIVCTGQNGEKLPETHIIKEIVTNPNIHFLVYKYLHPIHIMSCNELQELYIKIQNMSDKELIEFTNKFFPINDDKMINYPKAKIFCKADTPGCSQFDQAGILDQIFTKIGTTNKYFVEFGSRRPQILNSSYFRMKKDWGGLLLDASPLTNDFNDTIEPQEESLELLNKNNNDHVKLRQSFITKENINNLFRQYNVPKIFDLLTIDIDKNDYHVLEGLDLNKFTARVIAIEFSSYFTSNEHCVSKYIPTNSWGGKSITNSSLRALNNLMRTRQYSYVGHASGEHAFFVKDTELPKNMINNPIPYFIPEGWQYKNRITTNDLYKPEDFYCIN